MRDVAELVGENLRFADLRVNVAMRVTIYPIVYIRICDIIAQLHRKRAIDRAASKLLCCTLLRWYMMSQYDLRLRFAFFHNLADKIEATFVLDASHSQIVFSLS